jgi:glycosyltransferase involved in cell wall biosynthesis
MPETPVVAYVLKGFPRMSELFIASEIHRVEKAGVPVRLFVIRPRDEELQHPVVDLISARPEYLPPTTSLSGEPIPRWLAHNAPRFLRPLAHVARSRPAGLTRAAAAALAQALRARKNRWGRPRKVYLKEFLLAVALADGVLRAGDVRHLHAHFAHGATTVTWLASMIVGLPFSFTGHAKDIYSERLNPAGLLNRKLMDARFAVTCTEANRAHLARIAPAADIHRVYHGLNADFARLLLERPAASAANGRLRILAVGRLVEKKGFDVVVDAHALIEQRGVPAETTFAGGEDGDPSAAALRRQISRAGLTERVRLAGMMTQAQLLAEFVGATVFCLPCRVLEDGDRDGIPNVLVEAMAAGVPVVTTAVSGIPELVQDGVNGLVVPPDDPERLADAVLRLHADPGLRARLSTSGRRHVQEHFDGEVLAAQVADLFLRDVA